MDTCNYAHNSNNRGFKLYKTTISLLYGGAISFYSQLTAMQKKQKEGAEAAGYYWLVKWRVQLLGRQWNFMDIGSAVVILGLHCLALLAPFHFSLSAVWLAMALYVLTGLGVTLSYHRNLSHKSFKLPKWLEYSFAYCGTLALQVSVN